MLHNLVEGNGDYTIKKNSIIEMAVNAQNGTATSKDFTFSASGAASFRVQKREFIAQIVSPSANPELFNQTQFRIQPTDPGSFPWVSSIAKLFTEYKLHGAIYTFETTSSNYSANMGLGTVALATQYNANTLPFADMNSILQSAYHTRGNPSETLLHGIECDSELQASDRLFTRRDGTDGPPNLYDHGVLTIATEGLPAADVGLGRLYVTYDIEFSLPELMIKPAWIDDVGLIEDPAVGATAPPLGPSLTLVASAGSDMTVGAGGGNNVIVLSPSNGPVQEPALTPENRVAMVAWVNDDTTTGTRQYVSFARTGYYTLVVNFARTGGAGITGFALAVAALDGTEVTQMDQRVFVNATDHSAEWVAKIKVTRAGGTIQCDNADTAAHAAYTTLVYRGPI
jgi:hypothetical protein